MARKFTGGARVGDHEDGHAGLIFTPKQPPQPASLDVGRGEGFGEDTDAHTEDGEPLRFVEMFGQADNLNAETMSRPVGGKLIGLIGAGEHEGLARKRGRFIERLAVERMRLAAIGAVRLIEEKIVIEIGAKGLRRGDTDIDLVAQKRGGDRSHVVMSIRISTLGCRSWKRAMAASKRSHTRLEMTWIEIRPRTSSARLPSRFGTLRTSELSDRQVSATSMPSSVSFEATRSAPAQRDTELGLEPLECEAEGGLLPPERTPGAADPAGLGDFVERLQEVPIDVAGEVGAQTKHGKHLCDRCAAGKQT